MSKALAENKLHRELHNMTRPKLLIIDEVGYLQLDQTQASLFFQVISQRYDNNSAIILTSNKPFSDWTEVFAGGAIMASAALDRLLHRCTVINIRGESFRLKAPRYAQFFSRGWQLPVSNLHAGYQGGNAHDLISK